MLGTTHALNGRGSPPGGLTLGVCVRSVSCARVLLPVLLLPSCCCCTTAKAALLVLVDVVQVLLVLVHCLLEEFGLQRWKRATGKRPPPALARPRAEEGEAQARAAGEPAQWDAEGLGLLLLRWPPLAKCEMDRAKLLWFGLVRTDQAARVDEPAHRLAVHREDGLQGEGGVLMASACESGRVLCCSVVH